MLHGPIGGWQLYGGEVARALDLTFWLLTCLAAFCCRAAHAQSAIVELDVQALSAVHSRVSSNFRSGASIALPLGSNSVQFSIVESVEWRVPLVDTVGQQSSILDLIRITALASDGARGAFVVGEEGVFGVVVEPSEAIWRVRPLESSGQRRAQPHEVAPLSGGGACTVKAPSRPQLARTQKRPPPTGTPRAVELLAFAPSGFIGTRTPKQAGFEIASLISGASEFFESLNLSLEVAAVVTYLPDNDPFAPAYTERSADDMLHEVARLGALVKAPAHDASIVFAHGSGWEVDGEETVGLAGVGTICSADSAAFVTASPLSDMPMAYDVITVAHEVGHLLGMKHDSTQYLQGVSIMYPGATDLPFFGFSERSIREYEVVAGRDRERGSCLTELRDIVRPTVEVTSQSGSCRSGVTLQGSAADDRGIRSVSVQVGRSWLTARGSTRWTIRLPAVRGSANSQSVKVKAVDRSGNESTVRRVKIRCR